MVEDSHRLYWELFFFSTKLKKAESIRYLCGLETAVSEMTVSVH